jgi:hypothetical protein
MNEPSVESPQESNPLGRVVIYLDYWDATAHCWRSKELAVRPVSTAVEVASVVERAEADGFVRTAARVQ